MYVCLYGYLYSGIYKHLVALLKIEIRGKYSTGSANELNSTINRIIIWLDNGLHASVYIILLIFMPNYRTWHQLMSQWFRRGHPLIFLHSILHPHTPHSLFSSIFSSTDSEQCIANRKIRI